MATISQHLSVAPLGSAARAGWVPLRTLRSSAASAGGRWTNQKRDRVKNWRKHMSKKQTKRRRKVLQEQQALVEAREEAELIELPDGAVEALNAQYKEYGAIAHALSSMSRAPPPTRERE